jgi:DNA-binding GntR family transcriptional regulator
VHTHLHTGAALRSDHAYAELKERLLAGDFRLRTRLREVGLASLLGVSRTPIREALLRLHAEGLVQRQPDGGFVPVVPDVAFVRSLYEVRVGLELQAIQRPSRAGAAHDSRALAHLVEEWEGLAAEEPQPGPSFVLLDESFHIGLAEAAGNPALVDVLRHVNERIRTVRMVDFLTADRVRSTVEEHLGIARALLAGDLVGAERLLLGHVDDSQAVVEQRVSDAITRMATAPEMGEDR